MRKHAPHPDEHRARLRTRRVRKRQASERNHRRPNDGVGILDDSDDPTRPARLHDAHHGQNRQGGLGADQAESLRGAESAGRGEVVRLLPAHGGNTLQKSHWHVNRGGNPRNAAGESQGTSHFRAARPRNRLKPVRLCDRHQLRKLLRCRDRPFPDSLAQAAREASHRRICYNIRTS